MDDVLTVQLFGMICCSPTSSWLLCLPWSEPGSRFLSGGLDLKVQFLYPSVFSWTHYKRGKERFVKFLEFVGWKHRELVQIIKSTAAKHIYIWKVGVGVLDFWASSAQRPKLGPCGLDWDKFVLLLCVSIWGCWGGERAHSGNICMQRLQGVWFKGESRGRRSMEITKSICRTELCSWRILWVLHELSLLWGLGITPLPRGAWAALLGICFPASVQEWLSVNSAAVVLAQPANG